jgi:hypothetical protein
MAEEIVVSRFSHGAQADSNTDESLEKDEDDIVDAPPDIEQNSTRLSSSIPRVGGEGAIAFWVEAGADDEAKESFFDSLAASTKDSSAFTDLFTPAFIFSIPPFIPAFIFSIPAFIVPGGRFCPAAAAFGVAALATVFDDARVAAFTEAVALGAVAAFGAVESFGAAADFGTVGDFGATVTSFSPPRSSISTLSGPKHLPSYSLQPPYLPRCEAVGRDHKPHQPSKKLGSISLRLAGP